MKCYSCGSSIVGEQKTRHYKNGNSPTFTYYHCSRQVVRECKEPFAREQNIVDELSLLCNELISDLTRIEPGLKAAIDKFTKMMKVTHETYSSNEMVGGYIKYVLREGTVFEKTRLVRNINVELRLHDRKIITV